MMWRIWCADGPSPPHDAVALGLPVRSLIRSAFTWFRPRSDSQELGEHIMWMLWYADGSTVSSEDCAPEAVPGYGVQAIAQPDRTIGTGNVGYLTITGNWFYFRLDSQNWYAAETESDVVELLLAREPVIAVCRGRRLPDERFQEILGEAQAWAATHDLPRKSGFRPGERAR